MRSHEQAIRNTKGPKQGPRWLERPSQKNTMLLMKFMELREHNDIVTFETLKAACIDMKYFRENYKLLKAASVRSSGKIFQENEGIVELWPEVSEFVIAEYAKHKIE